MGTEMEMRDSGITHEQLVYARWLSVGTNIGLALLALTFAVYAFGLRESHIATSDLSTYWALPVHDYLQATNAPTGWRWTSLLHKADYLNTIGIVFLASVTAVCYVRILPIFIRKKDTVYAAILIAEILVLILAASDLLA